MALIGPVAKSTARVQKIYNDRIRVYDYFKQYAVLRKLIEKSKDTEFGKKYDFAKILKSKDPATLFSEMVPIHTYDQFYDSWLQRTLDGEQNVFWGEKIKYFALSSGTGGASSKKIPVSKSMIHNCRKIGVSQLSSIYNLNMPSSFYEKNVLMLGGSTNLKKVGEHFEGDLSGILVSNT
ncbi:MAG: GH3 auxin-responsive promoter family protein, partial [Crocinitomicaceae bacterium]